MSPNSPEVGPVIPTAIRAIYSTSKPNQELVLHEDALEVETPLGLSRRKGRLAFRWLPTPVLHIYAELDFQKTPMRWDPPETQQAKVRLLGDSNFNNITINKFDTEPGPGYGYLLGALPVFTSGESDHIHSIRFHIPNFFGYSGALALHESGTYVNRAVLALDPWRITIDGSVSGPGQHDLDQLHGYGITHVGKIERRDLQPFSACEAASVLKMLELWLSFCRGNWTAPILLVGFNHDAVDVWKDWSPKRITPSKSVVSWVDGQSPKFLEQGFLGFVQAATTEHWKEVLELAINWYVESNRQESGTEAALILAQAGLELLAWVNVGSGLTGAKREKFDNSPAKKKIRMLLKKCGIACDIPRQLSELSRFARSQDWHDGPASLAEIRNVLVHSNPAHTSRLQNIPANIRSEVWSLTLWYFELALLWSFNYLGTYRNRVTTRNWFRDPAEQVPWTATSSHPR